MRTLISLLLLVTLAVPGAAKETVRVEQMLALDGDPEKFIYAQAWFPDEPRALVVFTHGFTDNSRNHRRLYDYLLKNRYAVAAWDMIGHGASHEMRGYVDDFDDLVRALHMVRSNAETRVPAGTPVVMGGYSMGALVTLRYSELHDGDIAGSFYFSPFLKARMSFMRRLLNAFSGVLDRVLPRVDSPHGVTNDELLSDPEILAERADDPYFFETISVRLFRQLLAGIAATRAGAASLTRPLLFQVAGQELVVDVRATDRFYADIPATTSKQYHFYPEMRHELDNEIGREQVWKVVGDFLDRLTTTDASSRRKFEAIHSP